MSARARILIPSIATGAVAVVATASTVLACTALATVNTSSPSGAVGQSVAGAGQGFNPAAQITVRLDTTTGRILWSGQASSAGTFAWSFAVPDVSAGWHTIKAIAAAGVAQYTFDVILPTPPPVPSPGSVPNGRPAPQPAAGVHRAPGPRQAPASAPTYFPRPVSVTESARARVGEVPVPAAAGTDRPQASRGSITGDLSAGFVPPPTIGIGAAGAGRPDVNHGVNPAGPLAAALVGSGLAFLAAATMRARRVAARR